MDFLQFDKRLKFSFKFRRDAAKALKKNN